MKFVGHLNSKCIRAIYPVGATAIPKYEFAATVSPAIAAHNSVSKRIMGWNERW